jgi:RimJ/RimL family protein N-acetyltransferase
MLQYAFEKLKCIAFEIRTDALNTVSRRAIEYYDVDKSKEIQAKGKNTQSYKKKQRGIIKRRHSRYFECLP